MTIQSTGSGTAWTNWSGNRRGSPAQYLQPQSEEKLRAELASAVRPVRVVGAGHSFTPIVECSGTLVSLDRMPFSLEANAASASARFSASRRLFELSARLDDHNLAFRNLGDINVQSFAGAVATGTHGTGAELASLAAEIRAFRLLTASGEILSANVRSDRDLVQAVQVSLGALGILLDVEVALVPSYRLRRRTWAEPLEQILECAEARWQRHRHYEFFYIPFSGYGINVSHDVTHEPLRVQSPNNDEADLASLRYLRSTLKWSKTLRGLLLKAAIRRSHEEDRVDSSWRLLANQRETRFNEMEYHLPPAAALETLTAIVEHIEQKRADVFFPIEVRKTAGDDAWLSPFSDGARISIAVHAHAADDYNWFFSDIEPMFRAAGGRPHWGKLHSLRATDLAGLYPAFERFIALRRELDPQGIFLTPGLAQLWGED